MSYTISGQKFRHNLLWCLEVYWKRIDVADPRVFPQEDVPILPNGLSVKR